MNSASRAPNRISCFRREGLLTDSTLDFSILHEDYLIGLIVKMRRWGSTFRIGRILHQRECSAGIVSRQSDDDLLGPQFDSLSLAGSLEILWHRCSFGFVGLTE